MKKVLLRTISALTIAAVLFSTLSISAKPLSGIGRNIELNKKSPSDATYYRAERKSAFVPGSNKSVRTVKQLIAQSAATAGPCGPEVFNIPGNHTFTVPAGVSKVTITAVGAAGGDYSDDGGVTLNKGGLGAQVKGVFTVTPGETLNVLVGGKGGDNSDLNINPLTSAGGGGGGSFVARNYTDAFPMLAAGGGGGAGAALGDQTLKNANVPNVFQSLVNYGNDGIASSNPSDPWPTNGDGGFSGSAGSSGSAGGSGAGWLANGDPDGLSSNALIAAQLIGGANLQTGGISPRNGGGNPDYSLGGIGGIGGGGSAAGGGGGGGGYSGGGGGAMQGDFINVYTNNLGVARGLNGGGGGSYNGGLAGTQTNLPEIGTNDGYVIIEYTYINDGGKNTFCVGQTANYTDGCNTAPAGTWSSSNPAVATVSASGLVTAISAGTATITFASGNGSVVSENITVNALPVVNAISGNTTVVVNGTTALSSTTSGGVWSSSNTAVATINASTGLVTAGATAGTTTISYKVTNASGCSTTVTTLVTVTASSSCTTPAIVSTSGAAVCSGASATLLAAADNVAATFKWYDAATGGNLLASTASYTTPALSASTTYYVEASTGATCTTARVAVTASMVSINNQTVSVSPTALCTSGTATVTVANTQTGINYTLRNNANNAVIAGPVAGTGSAINFSTGTISASTTYNVLADNNHLGALGFNGSGSVSNNSFALTVSNGFTVEGWWYLNSLTGTNGFASQGTGNIAGPFDIYQINGTLSFWLGNGTASQQITTTITASAWHHIACVYDPTAGKQFLYVDGVLKNSASVVQSVASVVSSKLILAGRADNAYSLNGKLDDVRIWNTARSLNQITANKDLCITAPQTGLKVYYKLDDATGSATAVDASGNGFNGTLNNLTPASAWTSGNLNCTSNCSLQLSNTPTVTVNPNNTISLTSATGTDVQTVCNNTAITNITYATTGATGATFSGLPAGVSSAWSGNVVTISGTPTAIGTFNFTVTLTGGCGTVTSTGTITVKANNTISLSSAAGTNAQTVCISTPVTNITYATTGATGATFSGLPSGVSGVWAGNVVTISGTPTASGSFNYTVNLTGGCGTVSTTGTITVTANNTISLSSAAGTNAQTVCISTPVTNITYATTGATGATFSGLPSGVSGVWSVNVVTISGTPTANGTFNYTVNLTGGCGTVSIGGTITVSSLITPTFAQVAAICSGTTLSALPATSTNGISGTWSPALNNTTTTTYTFTPNANQCATTATMTITVNANPSPNISGANTVCVAGTTNLSATLAIGGTLSFANGYEIHTFTTSGTLTSFFTGNAEVLVVAGGGGGGSSNGGGGGGAGGLVYAAAYPLTTGAKTVNIGNGGVAGNGGSGSSGQNSIFDAITAIGGGGGAACCNVPGISGGSGGGQGRDDFNNLAPGNATQGNSGGGIGYGNRGGIFSNNGGTGGGGAGAAGGNSSGDGSNTGVGGAGMQFAQFAPAGSPAGWFAGGGGGSLFNPSLFNAGGIGGGGRGNNNSGQPATAGVANTGGGGGGGSSAGWGTAAQPGGSGIVIVRIANSSAGNSVSSTWTSSDVNVATVSSTGVVTGVNPGTATITYTETNAAGCSTSVSTVVTVNPLPTATISGTTSVCQNAATPTVTFTGANGTAPYTFTYTINGGAQQTIVSTGNTATISVPTNTLGTFTYALVSVKDASSTTCSATATGSATVSVTSIITPTFTQVTAICSGSTLSALPTTSNNGITGTWSPALNNTATTTYTFTPSAGQCATTATMTITVNPNVTPTFTQVAAICSGATLSALPTTSNNGITGTWSPALNNTTTTTYTFTPDAGQCATSTTMTITVNSVNFTTSSTNVLCFGGNTGTITVTPGSGTAPYTYSKNGGVAYQGSNTFSGLTAGTYSIVVKDANNCISAAQSVTITQPASSLHVGATGGGVVCFGSSTGFMTFTVTGGTPPYTYSKDGITFQSSNTITGLSAGSYTFVIKDANGCTSNTPIALSQPAVLTVTPTATDVTCFGGTNGSISVSGTGGSSPYTYSKNGGTTFQSGNTFSGLSAGTYTIVIKDINACTATQTVTVGQPAAALSFTNSTVNTCIGQSNGSITVTASNGTAPYTYSKDGGVSFQSGNSFSSLAAGNYNVVVKDASGCTSSSTVTVATYALPIVGILPSGSTAICAGNSVTLNSNSEPGLTFSWNPGGSTSSSITVNSAGTYTLTGTNGNGCINSTSVTVTVNALPNVPTGTNASACAPSGVTISAIGAIGETINWYDAATGGNQIGTGNNFYTNNSGTFYAEAVSGAGCVSATRTAVTATVNPLPIISGGAAAICINGTTTFNGSGTPAAVNPWVSSNPAIASVDNAGVVTGHSSGAVQIMYTTSGGCTATVSVFVSGFPGVGILPAGATAICAGTSVTLNSNSEGGLTYVWTPGGATTSSITVNTAGTYTLEGTNSFGCKATASVTVTVNALPNAPTGTDASACAPNGVTISATGAAGETIKWYAAATGGSPISIGNSFYTNTAGTFYAESVSAEGCVSATRTAVTATINALPSATITASGSTSFCIGSSVVLTASAGSSYSWSTGATTQSITVTNSGNYSVTVTNASNCSAISAPITVSVNPYPVVTLAGTTCLDGSALTLNATHAAQVQWYLNGNPFTVNSGISTSGVVVAGGNGPGTANNQLSSGGGIADIFVDAIGNVYVADQPNHRITKWAPNATTGVVVAGGNGQGSDANQLNYPSRITVDAAGNVYVCDWQNHRVQKWAPGATSGVTIAGGNGIGSAMNQTIYPVGVIPNADGSIYVLEEGLPPYPSRVTKWAANATSGVLIFSTQYGTGPGQVQFAENMVMDQAGNFILNEPYNKCILKYAPTGNTNQIGQIIAGGNGNGTDANQTSAVTGMLIDAADNLYLAEYYGDGRITKWAPGATSGVTLLQGGQNGDLSLFTGYGIGKDASNNFYLGDSYRARVLKFTNSAATSYIPTTAGTYTVTVTSESGCSTTSNPVVVNEIPVATIAAAGPSTTCPGNTVTLNANTGSGYTYQWYKNAVMISGATGASFNAATTGSYTVIITSNGCVSPVSNAVVVTIQDIVPPVIPALNPITAECFASAPIPTATDACTGNVAGVPSGPTSFNTQGDHIIHWTFTDGNGNSSSADQHVIIHDVTPPVPHCPDNISVISSTTDGHGNPGAIVTYAATATDNCTTPTVSYSIPSGSFFPYGTTTVTVTADDGNGNTATCTFDVTVSCVAPVITSTPANQTINTTLGRCDAPASYTVTASGIPAANLSYAFTGATAGTGSGTGSGAVFNKGITSVTVTAINSCGSVSSTFTITVEDHENPAIVGLPANISTVNDAGVCGAVVTWGAVSATDNCPGVVLVSDHNSGEVFPVGTTTVHYTATDVSHNSISGSFDVTVSDNERPTFTCPSDIVVSANTTDGHGVDGYIATYSVIDAHDNCAVASITYSIPSGSFFPIANTPVLITVTDNHGNVQTCTLHVIVNCVQPVITSTPVNQTIHTTLGRCDAPATYSVTASGIPAANLSYSFSGATTGDGSGTGSGSVFNKGETVVTVTATNSCGSISTHFTITVEDHENPVIVGLPGTINKTNDAGVCGAVVTWGTVTVTDNCPDPTIVSDHNSGEVFPIGTTTVHYTATDASGNAISGSFDVVVTDTENPVITVPADINHPADAGLCTYTFGAPSGPNGGNAQHPGGPGGPGGGGNGTTSLSAYIGTATATDNCNGVLISAVRSDNAPLNDPYPVGVTIITWTATDVYGHTDSHNQIITITDEEFPTITPPDAVTVSADANSCATAAAHVTLGTPVTGDNCAVLSVSNDAPSSYQIGTTTVTWSVTDIHGHTSTATQIVTVKDNQPPSFTCPGNITVAGQPGLNGANISSYTVTDAADNCGTPTVSYSINPGNFFALGTTTPVTITVTDAAGNHVECTINVTVTNNPPVANPDFATTPEDTPVTGNVLGNDTDLDGHTLNVTGFEIGGTPYTTGSPVTIPGVGVIVINTDGSFTFTPAPNYNGQVPVITYYITDNHGGTASSTLAITVTPVNDVPVAVNDTESVNEDGVLTSSVGGNDTQSGDGGNVWSVVNTTTHGTLVFHPDGTYTYTPDANFHGTDIFTYTLCDADHDCSPATVTITVNSVNDVPVAVNDTESVNEDGVLTSSVGGNDTQSGDGGNVWSVVNTTTHGTLVFHPDGTYTYTPDANFHGTDMFTYTLCDADGDCSTATVTITVNSVNDVPVAVNDTETVNEDGVLTSSVGGNDTQSGDGGNTWAVVTTTTHGVLVFNTDGTYTYTPNANFHGTDMFTYTLCDADGDCSTATVTITVNSVNDVPVAANDTESVNEDGVLTSSVGGNDILSGDGGNTWSVVTTTTHGTLVFNTDGTYTYTPDANFHGTDMFTYTLCDADGDCSTATVTITVNSVNDVPVAANDTETINEDNVLTSSVNGNDILSGDGGNTWSVVTTTTHGSLVFNTDGTYTYTPATNYHGTDAFTYKLCDADGDCSIATVIITINSVDDPAVIKTKDRTIYVDATGHVSITAGDIDDGSYDPDGISSITINKSDFDCSNLGPNTVTMTVTDVNGNSASAIATVTVLDIIKPSILCPAPVTVQCASDVPAVNIASVTAADNCSAVISFISDVISNQTAPNKYTITRTYRATDPSNNWNECTQIITVNDNTKPVLTYGQLPGGNGGQCLSGVPAAPSASTIAALYSDNCNGTVTAVLSSTTTTGSDAAGWTRKYFYTVSDVSGNSATACVTYTGKDNIAPVPTVATLPTLTGQCSVTAMPPTAVDNCAGTVTATTLNPTTYTTQGTYTITWSYTDGNGNTSTQTQTVIVKDNIAPVLTGTLPTGTGYQCLSGVPAAPGTASIAALYSDNCTAVTAVLNSTTTTGSDATGWTRKYTYTVSDANGNSTIACVTYTGKDNIAPVPTVATLPTLTGQCSVTATAPTAVDNCAGTVTATTLNPTSYTAQGTYTITWSYTDGNGNTSTQTQTAIVKDKVAPVPTVTTLPVLTGQCSVTATAPTAVDNCVGTVTATTLNPTTYTTQGTYTIIWNYSDGNGNTSTQTQTVIVKDNIAPVITCPSPITANATSIVSGKTGAYVTYAATATDNCGTPTITYSPASGSFFQVGTTTVTATANDGRGNTSTCQFTVTVGCANQVLTVISTPTNNTYTGGAANSLFLGYGAQSTTLQVSNATAGSTYLWSGSAANKLSSTTTATPVFTPSAAGSYTFSVLVTNAIGCQSTATISICVTDIRVIGYTPPTSVDPDDNQGMCDHQAHDSSDCPHEGHNHTCDHKAHSKYTCHHKDTNDYDDDDEKDCDHYAHTAARCPHKGHNHKACDHKAHSASKCEHDRSVSYDDVKVCDHKAHSYNDCTHEGHNHKYCNHQAHTSANCPHNGGNGGYCNSDAKVYICHVPPGNPGKTITLSISVNAVADHLANHPGDRLGTCDQQACTAYTDVTPPVLTCAPAVSVNCGTSTAPSVTGSATATDNMGMVTVTYTDANSTGKITRTWKATDAAGNISTCAQIITIVDNVAPVITDPSDKTVTCSSLTNPSYTGTATATDNCSTPQVTYSDVMVGNVITRTWTAKDASGNMASTTQKITIVDNVAPVITDPADVNVNCGTSTAPSATTGIATASDNCSTAIVTYSDVTVGNVTTRTWTAKDAAGNVATSTQKITVIDNVAPVITDPADITVNCGASTAPSATIGMATATDNCGTPVVKYDDVTVGNVITRTWTATDGFGNTTSSVQLITIGAVFTPVVSSVPTNSTYTGGVPTNLYLGYGAQSTTLQIGTLPSAGAPYTYVWSGNYLNLLNSTTNAAPVFTPTIFGYYTYTVTVTNKFGCKATASISICVTDIRVPGCNGSKVYVCHTPKYWWGKGTPQTVELSLSQVSSHLGSSSCGSSGDDRLGSSSQSPCNTTTNTSVTVTSSGTAKDGETMVATSDEDLKVTAMPNPSTTFFTLKIESRFQTPVELRVMDGRGRVVDAKSKLGANSTIQIGHNYSSGTYYAELIQGTQRKVVQLIKGRG